MNENQENKKVEFLVHYKKIYSILRDEWDMNKTGMLKQILKNFISACNTDDQENIKNEIWADIRTTIVAIDEIGLKHSSVCAIMLIHPVLKGVYSVEKAKSDFGEETSVILKGLLKVSEFSNKKTSVESENYIKLLLSIAEDIRVVFIIIAQHLRMMREAKNATNSIKLELSVESTYLYAPLAHRLGFYTIKSELEDLSLKYTDRETYDFIAGKLNETKRSRDKYIQEFIEPVNERLEKTGFKYDIKGRTKSISSIYNKLKKQKIEFESIYDLFAIRVILDAPVEQEKAQCWQVYSIITDMYQPNPKRLKDWLSIPKSNGYESLHITVMGPESKWVEVQIRSKRMDEIAERGLAAHWKYKGLKGESGLDGWLQSLRESLDDKETNLTQKLSDFKLDLYDEEIFVFTPKGDLFKLPKGATVLDFAFSIHSKLGATCMSGKVNGKNVPIKHVLKSGDQVEINTSSHQTPKQDWLSSVVTSKAKTKIRQLLKEEASKQVDIAKETLSRRMKNRKIDLDDSHLMQLIKKLRYKTVTDFYVDIANGKNDINWVIDKYLEIESKGSESRDTHTTVSAEEFTLKPHEIVQTSGDELIIDQNLTGIDYKLAKCCNPIYGDEIFGFVSSQGIKIHRVSCPNAHDLFSRFGYRVIKARWSGKNSSLNYTIILRVIGNDQINIVANLMSIISKEDGVQMRSISIDSNDGLFQGNIAVMLANTSMLEQLIKKLKAVKGVKSITRLN
ncbi:MAG: TGS domain-containing protein [Fermentimonas sp.]|jgi:GTP pyrophosphokinase|nr:TGS domain-containing protein [Fermentimonas sp.]MDD2930287.1 TGS domain-containing protein [Fermentimonas sp.]MDD4283992.1 TGS domain-containing protein [Fermentimonas sp.]MDD4723862.1 TGS domain-containing protein [Fermentimonas sp.]HBT86850.1 RelA/SpoT family protein [Porphyromonadaceae bacterium]